MLRQRILTAIVIVPILALAIWFGSFWFTILIGLICILAGLEFYRIASKMNFQPLTYFGIAMMLLLVASYYFNVLSAKLLILTGTAVISIIWVLFKRRRENAFNNWVWTVGGVLYIGLMISYWIDVRNGPDGNWWVFWALFIVISCDTCAYFVGKALGKHKLAPTISPKKTWEGAIGGLVGSVVVAVGIGSLFKILFSLPIDYWQMAVLGTAISIIGQLGDLVESLLKRNAGVKDSGKLLPGHGGMLDRMDSYMFVGALLYFYVTYFAHTAA